MKSTAASMLPVLSILIGATLTGCAVGPDYKGPPALGDAGARFVRAPSDVGTQAPNTRWWTQLNDPLLSDLIERALKANPSIEVAAARLREARAALSAERAKELPNSGASAAYLRAHGLTSALGAASEGASGDTNVYAIGFDATWEVDLFGAHRRAVESAGAPVARRPISMSRVLAISWTPRRRSSDHFRQTSSIKWTKSLS
jgi:outer membrane protein TolC